MIEISDRDSKSYSSLNSLKKHGFDTSTASGKMVLSVIGAMAEYERNLMRERTMAGVAAARARGRMGGCPKSLDKSQVKVAILRRSGPAIALANEGELTIKEICEQVGCSRSTYYRQVAPRLLDLLIRALCRTTDSPLVGWLLLWPVIYSFASPLRLVTVAQGWLAKCYQ